jgi:hypothetical protein
MLVPLQGSRTSSVPAFIDAVARGHLTGGLPRPLWPPGCKCGWGAIARGASRWCAATAAGPGHCPPTLAPAPASARPPGDTGIIQPWRPPHYPIDGPEIATPSAPFAPRSPTCPSTLR